MKFGVNLPGSIPGADRETFLEWARRADAGPFSSIGITDRLAYPNLEPLAALAAAAAVTSRVRLLTNVVLLGLHNAGVFAKQAATIDVISNGRLSVGVGMGSREEDYAGAPAPFAHRGKRFEEQLAMVKRIWAGGPAAEGCGPVGPAPVQKGGPELLIGARDPKAIARVGRWADGYLVAFARPETSKALYQMALDSWREHGRQGKPRLVGMSYFSLGPDAHERASHYLERYWAYTPGTAAHYLRGLLTTPQAIKNAARDREAIGMDEYLLVPCQTGPEQVDRLADIIG